MSSTRQIGLGSVSLLGLWAITVACGFGQKVAVELKIPTVRIICAAEREIPGPNGEVNFAVSLDLTNKEVVSPGATAMCREQKFWRRAEKEGKSRWISAEGIDYASVR